MKLKFELITTKQYEVSDKPTFEEFEKILIRLSKTSYFSDEEDEENGIVVSWYYRVRIPVSLLPHLQSLSQWCPAWQYGWKARPNELGTLGQFRVFKEVEG